MVLEQAGVRAENWNLIPWISGLFLPLNPHLSDFCYALLDRAITYKQESLECLEKTGLTMMLAPGRVSMVRVSLSYFILCTIPTHCITANTSACVTNELLKVKSGPTDIRQYSLWLWWKQHLSPHDLSTGRCSASTEKRVDLGVKICLLYKICLKPVTVTVAKDICF